MIKDDSWKRIDANKRHYIIDYIERMTPLTITRTNSDMTANDVVDTYNY